MNKNTNENRTKLLAVCLIISLLAAFHVNAEELFIDGSLGESTAQSTLEIHVYSTFLISVPVYISNEYSEEITVTNANLEPDYHASVSITNLNDDAMVDIVDPDGDNAVVPIYIDDVKITEKDAEHIRFDGNDTHYIKGGGINGGDAGHYTGVIQYAVSAVPN